MRVPSAIFRRLAAVLLALVTVWPGAAATATAQIGSIALAIECAADPERTTVRNDTDQPLTLGALRLGSLDQPRSNEPFTLPGGVLPPGGAITYLTGEAAPEGTLTLTRQSIYDNASPGEGARLTTPFGTLTVLCSAGSGSLTVSGPPLRPPPPPPGAPERCFPETGQCVRGRFLERWTNFGGLAINGYPLTPERTETLEDGRQYVVQWFERVRMELHPENAPPNDILLGQFGRILHPADPPVAAIPGMVYFPETGHNMPPDFAAYYAANGGLSQFGYPLSEVIREQLEDGQTYEVQYTERARFERHPENAPPYTVLLGQFGRRILALPKPPTVVLQDDFSNPASGWPQREYPDGIGSIGYADGGYRILVASANTGIRVSHPRMGTLTDTQVEVDATKVGGPDSGAAGIICRSPDVDNFYVAMTDVRGRYTIQKRKSGAYITLADWSGPSPAIRLGNGTNRLRFDCIGDRLTLYANGQKLAEVRDGEITPGRVFMTAWSGQEPGVEYGFDNFVARRP